MVTPRPPPTGDTALDRVAEALSRVPEVAAAALADGQLRVVVGADPVAAGRAVVPTIGDLLARYPDVVADVAVLPSDGRPARALLPADARLLLVRPERADG